MTKFIEELDLRDNWRKFYNDQIDLRGLCRETAEKLSLLDQHSTNRNLQDIKKGFESLANQQAEATTEAFDIILKDLYEWCDEVIEYSDSILKIKKRCWIKTI